MSLFTAEEYETWLRIDDLAERIYRERRDCPETCTPMKFDTAVQVATQIVLRGDSITD